MQCRNLRFVVHKHKAKKAGLHYDLRIQKCNEKMLQSYAIRKGIPLKTGEKHLAIRTPDHEWLWLNFQGEIPEGEYGAGTIEIWDKGKCDLVYEKKNVKLYDFHGKKMKGLYALVHLKGDSYLIVKSKHSKSE